MNTRTRGKTIARAAGIGLVAASTAGATAVAAETYRDISTQQEQTGSAPASQQPAQTQEATDSGSSSPTATPSPTQSSSGSQVYVQQAPAGSVANSNSGGS